MKRYFTIAVLYVFISIIAFSQKNFTVLQLNVWQEGTMVKNGLDKIADVIVTIKPDVVTFSEVRNYKGEDWTNKVIEKLGEKGEKYYGEYVSGDVTLISRFPVEETDVIFDGTKTDGGSVIAYLLNFDGDKMWVCPGHLDYRYYAVYMPRGYTGGIPDWNMIDDGNGNPAPVTNIETILAYNKLSKKDEAVKAFISFSELHKDVPVLLGMDMNGASHLDWTEKTKDMFDHHGLVIPWNNTLELEKAGFTDAYRKVYPDEVNYPGITWPAYPAGYKKTVSWTPKADERDRIDFIFYKGKNLNAADAFLVGSKVSYVKGQKVNMDSFKDRWLYDDDPWPSDHFGVLVKFELKP